MATTSKLPPLVPTRLAWKANDFGVKGRPFFGFRVKIMALASSCEPATSVGWNIVSQMPPSVRVPFMVSFSPTICTSFIAESISVITRPKAFMFFGSLL